MSAPLIIYLDTTARIQVANFLATNQPGAQMIFEAGDNVPIQLHFLQRNTASGTQGQLPYSYIDPSTVLPVSLAIGDIGATPTAGTFTVTFGVDTTTALPFNVTAAALSTALNLLATVTSAGGITVTGGNGGPWTIVFTTPGVISSLFAVNAGELVPVSQGITARAVTGASGIQEVQVITLLQSPAALQNTWTATYGTGTVTELQAGGSGLNEIQQIAVPQGAYGGSFAITFDAVSSVAIPYNATAAQVQAALQGISTIGSGNCSVLATSPVTWSVTFIGSLAGASQSLMTISSTGLQMPMYLAAAVNLNVQGVFNLLIGEASTNPTLQVQQGTSGNINTVLQTTVTLNNTLIQGTPSVPNPADPWQTLSQVLALIDTPANLPIATTTTVGAVEVPAAGGLVVDGSGNLSILNLNTRVASPFAVTSSAVLTNVTGLSVPVVAAGKYSFEAVLFTTATSGGGIQAAIAGTATATSILYEGLLVSGAAIVAQTRSTALGGAVGSSGTATTGTIRISGTIVVNAGGTLTVQFAQNTTNGSPSTVLAGSWFKVWADSN